MQTRFLYTCISSVIFAGEDTLNQLHEAFADDAMKLFTDGVLVTWLLLACTYGWLSKLWSPSGSPIYYKMPYYILEPERAIVLTNTHMACSESVLSCWFSIDPAKMPHGQRLYFVCIGVKGDQVYLRKVSRHATKFS